MITTARTDVPNTFPLPTRSQTSDVAQTLGRATSSLSNGSSFATAALGAAGHYPTAVTHAGEGAGLLRSAAAVLMGIAPQMEMLAGNLMRSADTVVAAASRPEPSTALVAALAAAKGDASAAASAVQALPTSG